MKKYHLLGAVMALMLTAPAAWAADSFWEDPNSRLSLRYPEGWRIATNKHTDDALTVLSPAYTGRAQCRVRTNEDDNVIYHSFYTPFNSRWYARNQQFWDKYLGQFGDLAIHESMEGLSSVNAPSRSIIASYTGLTSQHKVVRRVSQIWTGVYMNTAYILDCSADESTFSMWFPTFQDIASTIRVDRVLPSYTNNHLSRNYISGNPLNPLDAGTYYAPGTVGVNGYRYQYPNYRFPNTVRYERVSWNDDAEIYNRNN